MFLSLKMCENKKTISLQVYRQFFHLLQRHQGTKSGLAKALTTNVESHSIQTWFQCLSKASSMARVAAKHSA